MGVVAPARLHCLCFCAVLHLSAIFKGMASPFHDAIGETAFLEELLDPDRGMVES